VRAGGADLAKPGIRAVPSLTYLQATPSFTEHFFESEDEGDESVDNGPTGGLTWDGRVDRGRAQARIPLFSPFEMANETEAALAQRLRRAGYATALGTLLHKPLDRPPALVEATLAALEAYEQDAASFYPYSSKYDLYLAGKAALSPEEARGLALFEDPAKGNCAQCHISARGKDGTPPQFTDYGLIALGVPRNTAIPANADPGYFDLGLCGPVRTDFKARAEYCGLFKTPSLRNTALRPVFMHNGVFRSLREVVEFYAERDTAPTKWYGAAGKFDDLPAAYWKNINTDPPFGGRPALDAQEIDDIVAFLGTLTDGYRP
jgi:cytochrome c peroxidase